MSFSFDRRSYRLPYPPTARARLTLGKRELALVDLSERGIRYVAEPGELPELGSRIAGEVRLLSHRAPLPIEGRVVRCHGGEVAVELDAPGLPMRLLFGEQRYLAQRFPARFSPAAGA